MEWVYELNVKKKDSQERDTHSEKGKKTKNIANWFTIIIIIIIINEESKKCGKLFWLAGILLTSL